jgi:hypothetical protein
MRVFSFGGGVQSMAVMVLSAQGKLPYTHFLFANVGDDSENPDTLDYIRDVAIPYASANNLQFVEVSWDRKTHEKTLYRALIEDYNDIAIPVRMKGAGPGYRNCTTKWKVQVIERWCKEHTGASRGSRTPVGVGISTDESHRMRTDDPERDLYTVKEYPLIDHLLNRSQCQRIIANAGLTVPPKSSCWFCPYKSDYDWVQLKAKKPDLFEKVIHLEDVLNEKRKKFGNKDQVFLWNKQRPLRNLMEADTVDMFDDDFSCVSGHCMT